MAFGKGHEKLGGRNKGSINKKTAQWESFSQYCLNGGLEKFQQELDSLSGKDFIIAFSNLLEFHKPKLARNENVNKDTGKITIKVVRE